MLQEEKHQLEPVLVTKGQNTNAKHSEKIKLDLVQIVYIWRSSIFTNDMLQPPELTLNYEKKKIPVKP